MKLEQIKCQALSRAKAIFISPSYIIGCTGQKAIILDRQLHPIHTVEGLSYVYFAQVSPDNKKLLLISNGTHFHLIDLQTFEKTRVTVKAPYDQDLDGLGCWSFDSKSVWICARRWNEGIVSTLRRYDIDDLSKYEEYLPDKYCFVNISRLDSLHSLFLIGYRRWENPKYYFIHFDGTNFQKYPLPTSVNFVGHNATVNWETGVVNIYSFGGCQQFTLEGKELTQITHPAPKDQAIHASEVFAHLFDGNPEMQNQLKELSTSMGLENVPVSDDILKYGLSSCGKYIFLASQSGFYMLDAQTRDVLSFLPEKHGAQSFEELSPGVIAVTTWNGVKLYKY